MPGEAREFCWLGERIPFTTKVLALSSYPFAYCFKGLPYCFKLKNWVKHDGKTDLLRIWRPDSWYSGITTNWRFRGVLCQNR